MRVCENLNSPWKLVSQCQFNPLPTILGVMLIRIVWSVNFQATITLMLELKLEAMMYRWHNMYIGKVEVSEVINFNPLETTLHTKKLQVYYKRQWCVKTMWKKMKTSLNTYY